MGNPLVDQGTLNRIRGSIVFAAFPELNVTAGFLGEEAIKMALEGEAVDYVPTLTGAVTSPAVYQIVTVRAHLLKTQFLAGLYKAQVENNALVGKIIVRGDARTLPPYQFENCSISTPQELSFDGKDAGYMVMVKGFYNINASLFDAA